MNASAAAGGFAPFESVFVRIPRAAAQHGAVNLAQGVFDHGPATLALEALAAVGDGGEHQYTPSAGHPALRAALAGHVERYDCVVADPETDITVTAGATEALYSTLTALLHRGDEAVIIEPAYEQYAPAVRAAGGTVRPIRLRTADDRLDSTALEEAITPATRVIIVNSPWNPLGRSLDGTEWRAIAEAAGRRDIVVVSDETYEHLRLDGGTHQGVLQAITDPELRVKVSSASKTLAVTGWRIGWAVAGPGLTRRIRAAHQFITFCPAAPLQLAVARVLEDERFPDVIAVSARRLASQVGAFVDVLQELGLASRAPDSGFYVLADTGEDATDWCDRVLADGGVAALPLSVFYSEPVAEAATTVRFALCKKEVTVMEAARRLRKRLDGSAGR